MLLATVLVQLDEAGGGMQYAGKSHDDQHQAARSAQGCLGGVQTQ